MSIEQEAPTTVPTSPLPRVGANFAITKKNWMIVGGVALMALVVVALYMTKSLPTPNDTTTETYTATGENGEQITYSAGTHVALPENWPASVPMVPDAVVTSAGMVDSDNGPAIMATFTTERSVDDASTFYQEELTGSGWDMNEAMNTEGASVLLGTMGLESSVMVSISKVDEQTNVGIAIQNVE